MYKWIGVLSEFDFSISGWIYTLIFLMLLISFLFVLILNIKTIKQRQLFSFFACLSSLFIFGIAGFFILTALFFIIYALKSDFKKDYDS